MKKIEWANPDKMVFHTGHATFDRQTNIITHGNVIANTMRGQHVRAWNDDWHWQPGKHHEPGYLHEFDLASMKKYYRQISRRVWDRVKALGMDRPLWVYVFFHWNGNRKTVHGVVITAYDHKHLETYVTGPTYKSYDVVYEARKYVADL